MSEGEPLPMWLFIGMAIVLIVFVALLTVQQMGIAPVSQYISMNRVNAAPLGHVINQVMA